MWSQYHKNKFPKLRFLSCPRRKTALAVCVPAHSLGHYWLKHSFRVFGTGCDRLSARVETAKNVLPYPSRHILSQHPHSHLSEWVPQGHRGCQNRQHSKNGRKMHKLPLRSPHSAPYKPHGVETRKHFFSSKSKKPKRFLIFDPKKGGVIFSTFLTQPPPPHLRQNLKKWVSSGGGGFGGGPDQKLIGGCVYWKK